MGAFQNVFGNYGIGSGSIVVVNSQIPDIVIGDDYLLANGRAISFGFAPVAGFTLENAVARLGVKRYGTDRWKIISTGSLSLNELNDQWVAVFEIRGQDTEDNPPGYYDHSVELEQNGVRVTVAKNTSRPARVKLVEKQT